MTTFTIRRLLLAVLTIWALSVLLFFIIQLPPSDYVDTYVIELLLGGQEGGAIIPAMEALEEVLRVQYGLDKPVYVQYSKWVWKILHGVFGQSLEFQKPVIEVISERLLMTIILAGTTALLALWMLWVTFVYFSDIGIVGLFFPDYIEEPWSFGRVLD